MSVIQEQSRALSRAGNVFMWAATTGDHPDATPEGAAEQIIAMYLRERRDNGDTTARAAATRLLDDFPKARR